MSKTHCKLKLLFDVDQITSTLNFEFQNKKGKSLQLRSGPNAGTFNFSEQDRIEVEVTAFSKRSDKVNVTITECFLVSCPMLQSANYYTSIFDETQSDYYISMFDKHQARTVISNWDIPKRTRKKGHPDEIKFSALTPLTVRAKSGHWHMTGYLSVLIEKTNKDGKRVQIPRLYSFDPEGSAGLGNDERD